MKNSNRRPGSKFCSFIATLALSCVAVCSNVLGGVPPPEKILPDDTLVLFTLPDFVKVKEMFTSSPQLLIWNDPAMKPFKEKFLAKWKEDFVQPLERELNVRFEDYTSLPQGQVTFALTQNGWQGDEQPLGMIFLLDAREKGSQLKTNLADLRKKWMDAGKPIKTEKIRDLEFSVLPISSNDVPKTLRKFFPEPEPVQELGAEESPKKQNSRNELVVGQFESLLIAGNSIKVVEKVVGRLSGGTMPTLGELAAYDANHQALFRDAPGYGWINMKAFIDIFTRKPVEKKPSSEAPDPFSMIKPEKIVAATGLAGLKTFAMNFRNPSEGGLVQLFAGVPEASRAGLFKILAGEPKDCQPPSFVPADAVKFQRWRIDGQKTWTTLEKMLSDISPQLVGYLNFVIDSANTAAKDKDPGFDLRKNLIGNLGDDMITYEKAPRGTSLAQLKSPPSLFLLGSPNPEQFVAALKGILGSLSQSGSGPSEREFLGRKIYTVQAPTLPFPTAEAKPTTPRTLSYVATSAYVAISSDASLVEEFLRSSESQGKTLRETPGLAEAIQKVTGPGSSFFGYENQAETMRATFAMLKKDPAGAGSEMLGLPGTMGAAGPWKTVTEWMDFSLLPEFDRVAKYFHFAVYGGGASVDGLTLKMFTPVPPGLKK